MVIAGLAAAGWITALLAAAYAPLGYQDEAGFHYGSPGGTKREQESPVVPHALR